MQLEAIEPLDDILSEDFWISPANARAALDAVRVSMTAFDLDVRNALAAGTLPASEGKEWANWKRQFEAYYNTTTSSFADWRLFNATGVLRECERIAADLTAWRMRFAQITKSPATTPNPVRGHVGPALDGATVAIWALSVVGAIYVYNRIK